MSELKTCTEPSTWLLVKGPIRLWYSYHDIILYVNEYPLETESQSDVWAWLIYTANGTLDITHPWQF